MNAGDTVPDFEAPDQTGTTRSLSELVADGPIVLFFYPRAMTSGCTAESCHFRDLKADLAEVGATPVGISDDPVAKQQQFDAKHSLGYPLLSDPDKAIAKIMGVKRFGPLFNKRQTFVIGKDRKVIGTIASEMNMERHADEALALLKA